METTFIWSHACSYGEHDTSIYHIIDNVYTTGTIQYCSVRSTHIFDGLFRSMFVKIRMARVDIRYWYSFHRILWT